MARMTAAESKVDGSFFRMNVDFELKDAQLYVLGTKPLVISYSENGDERVSYLCSEFAQIISVMVQAGSANDLSQQLENKCNKINLDENSYLVRDFRRANSISEHRGYHVNMDNLVINDFKVSASGKVYYKNIPLLGSRGYPATQKVAQAMALKITGHDYGEIEFGIAKKLMV